MREVRRPLKLEEAVSLFRDGELNLSPHCYTGEEWGNGAAQKMIREDYRRAVLEKDPTIKLLPEIESLAI